MILSFNRLTVLGLILIGIFLFFGCGGGENPVTEEYDIAFDAAKWDIPKDHTFLYRDRMLKDFMEKDVVRGMTKNEVIELLGEPTRIDNDYLFYLVDQQRLGLWPLHTKTLVLKLSEEGKIHKIMIHK